MTRRFLMLPLFVYVVAQLACSAEVTNPLGDGEDPDNDGRSADAGPKATEGTADEQGQTPGEQGPSGPKNMTFRGPLNMSADPFMTYKDGFYYLSTTQGDALRMWKSPTVGGLLAAEPVTIWRDDDPSRSRDLWAPSFYFIDGHWYVYYTATTSDRKDNNHRIFVLESDGADALGPYHFKGKVAVQGNDYWAIDAEVMEHDGKRYVLWSGSTDAGAHNLLYIARLSNPWTITGGRTYLAASGGCREVREGPSVLQHDGSSFLVYSACDTGKPDYQLWMKTLAKGADPMVAANWKQHPSPVMTRNDGAGVWGPGHNGFFKSPDGKEDWIIYHGKNTPIYTYEGRTTRIDKVTWNANGMPSFGAPPATGADRQVPSGDPGGGPFWIDDGNTSSGPGSVAFSGDWKPYASCGVTCFKGNDHGTTEAGAVATFSFTGTRISLLSVRDAGNGIGAVSIDDGQEAMVDFYMPARHGEQLIYVSRQLPYGPHTLKLRATGTKNGASRGTAISVDRAEVSTL